MPPHNPIIRKFKSSDREAVRSITYNAAFLGEPAAAFFDGEEIVSDALTLYFTDYEPQSYFVAEVEGGVVGCLAGTKNKNMSEKVSRNKIWPYLLRKALLSGAFFKKKNLAFIFNSLSSIFRGEHKIPDFTAEYPATLHINIKDGFRGKDIGSMLMDAYLDYLKEEGIPGVHLATMSDRAANFFSKQGFVLLYKGTRSYFRHILHRDVPLYIYGKKLI